MVNPCEGVDAIPPPTTGPAAPTTKPGLFSLANWKLTLPIGSKGSPTEIKQPALASFRDARFFYVNGTGNGIFFKCPGDGVTTKNSKNPRTELREMTVGGGDEAEWSAKSGTNTMIITQKIHAAPHPVVAGQVHDDDDDVCVFRYQSGNLYASDGDNPTATLIGAYVLGTSFEAKFIASGGSIGMYYNGVLKATRSAGSGCYFKAGCYNQSNGSSGDALVEILGLTVSHT